VARGRWRRRVVDLVGASSLKELVYADEKKRRRKLAYFDVGRLRSKNDDKIVIIVVIMDWRCVRGIVWKSDDLVAAVLDDGLFAKVGSAGSRRIL
jgi:hypothetical protein